MFSKSADPPHKTTHPPRWSITRRLVVSYTLSAIAMLVISAAFLNWTLHETLLKGENSYIDDRVRIYRTIVISRPDFIDVIRHDIEWEGAFVRFPEYYARVLDEQCRTLIETPRMDALLPIQLFPDPCEFKEGGQYRAHAVSRTINVVRNGRSYLLESYWTDSASPVHRRVAIQIAIDITSQVAIIHDNQQRMIAIIIVGIVFASLFSVVVARRVLSPLDELAETARQITIEQINVRTEPARWPAELQSLAFAFNGMLARLEDSFNRLSQCASNLAHALRTPINNLMGEAEVALSQQRTAAEYQKVLESELEELLRLSRLVEAILFLARVENPATHLDRTLFDPIEEIEKICSFYEALAADKNAHLTWHGSGTLNGDRILVRRAVSNLVSNALYYSAPGVKIDVGVRQAEDNSLEIVVSDTGFGISEKNLNQIFDRFYRVATSHRSNPQGTGLGLSIVKSIMDLHNGTVSIQSVYGQGTTFILRFPRQAADQPDKNHTTT